MSENGEAKEAQLDADQIVITRDRKTGKVQIDGNVADLDLLLDMLGRATRYYDVRYRINAALIAQEEVKQQQAEYQRVQRLLGKA